MDDAHSEHPDEGTIHAWLDGALDDATAQALAAHAAGCRDCAERVAEARGLIAGASRVVSALDDLPSTAAPAWGQPPAAPALRRSGGGSAWRRLRVTPARAAIAATVLVALGVSLTYRHTAVDREVARQILSEPSAKPTTPPMAPQVQSAVPARDAVLDSALARNIAAAHPPRAVMPAAGAGQPVPELAPSTAVADRTAPTRVAVGRSVVQAQRDSAAGLFADQSAARREAREPSRKTAADPTIAAAIRADVVASPPAGVAAGSAPAALGRVRTPSAGPECYRVESANGVAAAWGPVSLPLVVALDAAGQSARLLTVAGQPTQATATIARAGEDSLLLRLRRIGYEGSLALGAAGDARAGVMRSRPLTVQLESVVTAAVEPGAEAPGARRASPQRRLPATAAADARADSAVPGLLASPAIPVVARRVACP
jgi:anti-sigma factor RsiW